MKFVAIGDSFTEGVGDEEQGAVRGWADLVAVGLASSLDEPVHYANLAIRGRLLAPVVTEQLDAALALEPTVISLNGGGNDIMRPGADPDALSALFTQAVRRCADAGVRLVVVSGGDPSDRLPAGRTIHRRGDRLAAAVVALCAEHGIAYVDNWSDPELRRAQYWSADRLHLNATGHHRVAARMLDALGAQYPADWFAPAPAVPASRNPRDTVAYYRQYVVPWVQRRLTGRSSGDDRLPKHGQWYLVPPTRPWP